MRSRIAKQRTRRTRFLIRDERGRYLYRHWSGEWRWTTLKADARVFRNQGSAHSRAALVSGVVEPYS